MSDQQQINDSFTKMVSDASEADIPKIAQNLDKMNRGALSKIWPNIQAMWSLIKDPSASWGAKAACIGALLYVISPIDVVPDVLPIIGLLDDVAVVGIALKSIATVIQEYKKTNI